MTIIFLQWLVTGCVVAGIATLAIRAVPASAAAERHLLWWAALAAVLTIPVVPFLWHTSPLDAAAVADPAVILTVRELPAGIDTVLVVVWGATAAFALVRLLAGLAALRRVVRHATPLDRPGMSLARRARVLVSAEVSGACAAGFGHPSIVVSSALVARLDNAMLDAIVLHESAHLARRDDWTRLVQRLVLAVAGLHPAVRWISRQIDFEREAACDQRVVALMNDPLVYARSLATAAELSVRSRACHTVIAPGASISQSGLHARITRIVRAVPLRPGTRATAFLSGLTVVCVAVAAALSLPPVVTIEAVEQPLAALASLPLARGLVAQVPDAAVRVATIPQSPDEVPAPVVRSRAAAPAVEADRPPHRNEPADEAVAEAHVPSDGSAVIDATPLPDATAAYRLPTVVSAPVNAEGIPGIGANAARAGVAAGSAASRAGQSIGRFFSRGGQAIANRF